MQHHLATRTALGALAAAVALSLVSVVSAQPKDDVISNDEYAVEIKKPEPNWEQSKGNEKAVAVFTHPPTQSQIEIVPTKLMTADVADVFFSTFHKTLVESNFKKDSEADKKIGKYDGKYTTYVFTHSGVTLKVHVFGFVKDTTAWLFVGYMQAEEEENIVKSFEWTIENLTFK
jgi:hypothetical protein